MNTESTSDFFLLAQGPQSSSKLVIPFRWGEPVCVSRSSLHPYAATTALSHFISSCRFTLPSFLISDLSHPHSRQTEPTPIPQVHPVLDCLHRINLQTNNFPSSPLLGSNGQHASKHRLPAYETFPHDDTQPFYLLTAVHRAPSYARRTENRQGVRWLVELSVLFRAEALE